MPGVPRGAAGTFGGVAAVAAAVPHFPISSASPSPPAASWCGLRQSCVHPLLFHSSTNIGQQLIGSPFLQCTGLGDEKKCTMLSPPDSHHSIFQK